MSSVRYLSVVSRILMNEVRSDVPYVRACAGFVFASAPRGCLGTAWAAPVALYAFCRNVFRSPTASNDLAAINGKTS